MPDRYQVPYHALARRGVIFVACLAMLSVFVWAENIFAQSFKTCVSQEASRQSANNADKGRFIVGRALGRQFVCSVDFLDLHAGFVAALAGLAVAGFTFTLWRSTERLWKASREHARTAERIGEAQVRAYVSVPEAQIVFVNLGVGWQPTASVVFKNSGSSPARTMGWNVAVQFVIGGKRRTRALMDMDDPKRWARTHSIAASESIRDQALITDMFIERFAPSGIPPVVRLQIRVIYVDVFDREIEVDAYFQGWAKRNAPGEANQPEWSVSILPCPRPNDWAETDTE